MQLYLVHYVSLYSALFLFPFPHTPTGLMILSIHSLVSTFAAVSLVNGAVVYRSSPIDMGIEEALPGLLSGQVVPSEPPAALHQMSNHPPKFRYSPPDPHYPGVRARGKNGPTNPSKPRLGTRVNQKSSSRLVSINSVDDWCTFGPKDNTKELGEVEEEVVAYCTKPRNGARVIPDGTVTAAHFVKTPLYVQVMALGDFTKINLKKGDKGGELDPHGATNKGNPHGGNVTSNVSGKDVFYQEWMNYISHELMCFRVCTAGSPEAPPQAECQHSLDKVGCYWIMPGDYSDNTFDSCEADAAYPPGIYVSGGSTSSFQQYATGVWTDNGVKKTYTNGSKGQSTPSAAMSRPSSSKCRKVSTISNGIKSLTSSKTHHSSSRGRVALVSSSPSSSTSNASANRSSRSSSMAGASSSSSTNSNESESKGSNEETLESSSSDNTTNSSEQGSTDTNEGRNGAHLLIPATGLISALIGASVLGALIL